MGSRAWAGREAAAIVAARTMCVLTADRPAPAALREITGAGALVETRLRPALASRVALRHPQAGTIEAEVQAHEPLGIRLRFDVGEHAVGFALAALASRICTGDRS